MIKNKIYYLLLGIGLGIIITSSMNIVFNKAEKTEYTDEQIKEKAKSLGMISIKENIENNDKEKTEKPKQEPKAEVNPEIKTESSTETSAPSTQVKTEHKNITITREDTASSIISKLKQTGIIENEEEFKNLVIKYNFQRKFRSGTYQLEKGMTYQDVLRKLIHVNELKNVGLL